MKSKPSSKGRAHHQKGRWRDSTEMKIVMDKIEDGNPNWLVTAPAFPERHDLRRRQARGLRSGSPCHRGGNRRPHRGRPGRSRADEDAGKGYFVEVPALTFLKMVLYMICSRRACLRDWPGWTGTGAGRPAVRLDHQSRLDQMEAAFEALGISLTMDVPAIDAAA